jgi:opacity protein-like surface antigen
MLKHTVIAIVALLLCMNVQAQDDPEYRFEVGAGIGMTGYLGDYNGCLTKDLQPAASFVGRYNFNPWMALRLNIGYGKLKGSSDDVKTWYTDEQARNYSFNNSLIDLAAIYEYNFLPYGTGRDYRGAKRLTPFVMGGMGLTMVKTTDKTQAAMIVPLGLGVKYKMSERVNIGLEWAVCFSTSDWLDGVKDPYDIQSSGLFKNTDAYQRLQLSLTYSFSARCLNCNKE